MSEFVNPMTFKELKNLVQELEKQQIPEDTKIFLDTGWDSLQEILPGAIHLKEAQQFQVQDVLTKETFGGYSLIEKAEKTQAEGASERVIVIENLY
ncbi:hypothetical protein [Candidatus Enterococcus willemsii]|uniref:Uncharacterized protein n=1 Tax=Candidatus Enterococcus willemsii TaxID=1857215 RepID=A0ABQ6Z2P5_9ENTE|nr:hypothetical protein [Enterococcus sp. CU12B]KAF1306034.1 hypothetical protein BAU17_03455 [Enterococcus sp. CU12B]